MGLNMKNLHQQNMKYKLIVFDFDGTIADTSDGILDAHIYALSFMNKSVPPNEELRRLIGGQLLKTYTNVFGFSEEQAKIAVKAYRKRYAEIGIKKAVLYPKFEDLLKYLKKKGYMIGVATLKAERFADEMLKEFEIRDYFDVVCGMDENDNADKASLVEKCILKCDASAKETVLIGDSMNDYNGAIQVGVNFIGVAYGFGFTPNGEYNFPKVDDVPSLKGLL